MSGPYLEQFPEWQDKLKHLSSGAWRDAAINESTINQWLENFTGASATIDMERKNALHLLAHFIYFGSAEITECLKVLYNEKIVYPHIQQIRADGTDIADIPSILEETIIQKTRFLGIGNVAESGPAFLYQFRKANNLPVSVFTTTPEVLAPDPITHAQQLNPLEVEHLVYLDDFCGTGSQASLRMRTDLRTMKRLKPTLKISYFLLFATADGLSNLKRRGIFDEIESVITFDNDYKAFSVNSHFYKNPTAGIDRTEAEKIMKHYGNHLGHAPSEALGFGNCQLMVGFYHNTPDNTLPVFWDKQPSKGWHPVFPRASKIEI